MPKDEKTIYVGDGKGGSVKLDKSGDDNFSSDAQVELRKEKEKAKKELEELAKVGGQVIYELEQVFPFRLFPNRVTIEVDKVTITYRDLLGENVFPILIEYIKGITVSKTFMFCRIDFQVQIFGQEEGPRPVGFLKFEEAKMAERYILGLIAATDRNIDLSKLSVGEVREKLEEIGKVRQQ